MESRYWPRLCIIYYDGDSVAIKYNRVHKFLLQLRGVDLQRKRMLERGKMEFGNGVKVFWEHFLAFFTPRAVHNTDSYGSIDVHTDANWISKFIHIGAKTTVHLHLASAEVLIKITSKITSSSHPLIFLLYHSHEVREFDISMDHILEQGQNWSPPLPSQLWSAECRIVLWR